MPSKDIPREEQQRRFKKVVGFLKDAEAKYPEVAKKLPDLLGGALGGQSFDPKLMVENEGFVDGGFAALGHWLKNNGFQGFEVGNLGLADVAVKMTAGALLVNTLHARDQFFAESGFGKGQYQELQNAMVDLSKTVGEALEVNYRPKQVLAALFIQSTAAIGDERAETSLPTREMLIKASGNNLAGVNQVLNRWVQGK